MSTTAVHAECAEGNPTTASRLFPALMTQADGARSLLLTLSDAAAPGAREAVHRAIVSWRATARIDADPDQLGAALRPIGDVDFGPAEVCE
ncbi:prevent-host-death family protein [Streptomyces sp. INA 01156]